MSFFSTFRLKSANDTTIPFTTRRIAFSTSQVIIDTLQQFGMLARMVRIVNRDAINNVTVRFISKSNETETIEPSTEAINTEWTSYIEVTPDSASGNGLIEIELVEQRDAYR